VSGPRLQSTCQHLGYSQSRSRPCHTYVHLNYHFTLGQ
jgi:hypothetical protein